MSVRPFIRAYVRTYVRLSTKSFFDFNEIWHVGRGRWVMHDGMQYDPNWSQGQGHEPFKVGNLNIFISYQLCHLQWELATDHWFLYYGTISKLSDIWPSFCVTWLWTWHGPSVAKSRPSVPYGANLLYLLSQDWYWLRIVSNTGHESYCSGYYNIFAIMFRMCIYCLQN